MEPNKMKQKRRKYLYAAAALGMTFLLNLSGCSRRFTNYPETAGTVAIVDSKSGRLSEMKMEKIQISRLI